MKTKGSRVSVALKEVWLWRETLTAGAGDKSVDEQLRLIARRGNEAARRFGFDGPERAAERVAEEGGAYGEERAKA